MTRGDRWVALVESWLDKADGDLRAAAACLQHPAVPGWIVGFHLQQAVEKTLKGLLVLHQREPPRSHHLARLASLLIEAGGEWTFDDEVTAALQPFAVDDRYPVLTALPCDPAPLVGLVPQVEAVVLAARQAVERQRTGDGGDGSG